MLENITKRGFQLCREFTDKPKGKKKKKRHTDTYDMIRGDK